MVVSTESEIGRGAVLEEYAVVDACTIGDYARIGSRSLVKAGAEVGEFETVPPDSVVYMSTSESDDWDLV